MQAKDLLNNASAHMADRAASYDQPGGERSVGPTVDAFNAVTGHQLTDEQGWLFLEMLKIVRSQQGQYRADNYEDAVAYAALRGEAASMARDPLEDEQPGVDEDEPVDETSAPVSHDRVDPDTPFGELQMMLDYANDFDGLPDWAYWVVRYDDGNITIWSKKQNNWRRIGSSKYKDKSSIYVIDSLINPTAPPNKQEQEAIYEIDRLVYKNPEKKWAQRTVFDTDLELKSKPEWGGFFEYRRISGIISPYEAGEYAMLRERDDSYPLLGEYKADTEVFDEPEHLSDAFEFLCSVVSQTDNMPPWAYWIESSGKVVSIFSKDQTREANLYYSSAKLDKAVFLLRSLTGNQDVPYQHRLKAAKYDLDALIHEEPWALWEFRNASANTWVGCAHPPQWAAVADYRRKSDALDPLSVARYAMTAAANDSGKAVPYDAESPIQTDGEFVGKWYRSGDAVTYGSVGANDTDSETPPPKTNQLEDLFKAVETIVKRTTNAGNLPNHAYWVFLADTGEVVVMSKGQTIGEKIDHMVSKFGPAIFLVTSVTGNNEVPDRHRFNAALYDLDSLVFVRPWELWQSTNALGEWVDRTKAPLWSIPDDYRRKPEAPNPVQVARHAMHKFDAYADEGA